jgi:hypothetical protein
VKGEEAMDGEQDGLRPIDFLTDEEREQEIARLQEEARRHQAEADGTPPLQASARRAARPHDGAARMKKNMPMPAEGEYT